MDANYSYYISTVFVIHSHEVESLEKLLKDHIGPVKTRIKCVDGITRELASVSDLLQYENPRSKEIIELRLSARSEDFSREASIDFSSSTWRGISLEFRADEDSVSKLKTGTLDIIDGARPWYGPVQSIDFVFAGIVAVLFLWFAAFLTIALSKTRRSTAKASTKLTDKQSAVGQLVMFGVLAAIFAVGFILNFLRDSWFPRAVFAIGQGDTRFQSLERFHWGFLIAILASVIAGIAILIWQPLHDKAVNPSGGSGENE
jgi:hypothetical protein